MRRGKNEEAPLEKNVFCPKLAGISSSHPPRTHMSDLVVYLVASPTHLVCGWPATGAVTSVLLDMPLSEEIRPSLQAPALLTAVPSLDRVEWCSASQAFRVPADVVLKLRPSGPPSPSDTHGCTPSGASAPGSISPCATP
jgi:hypothetical protein